MLATQQGSDFSEPTLEFTFVKTIASILPRLQSLADGQLRCLILE